MYEGALKKFYLLYPDTLQMTYEDHYIRLISNSTEFVGSYTRTFGKLGINAVAVIANDVRLQKKWRDHNKTKFFSGKSLIYNQILSYKPEILWLEDLRFLSVNELAEIRHEIKSIKLIVAYHCAPWNSSTLRKLKECDLVITCTPGLKQELENAGIKTYLIYHGFDKELSERIGKENITPSCDVLFSGSLFQGKGYHSSRIELLSNLLNKGINLALYIYVEKKSIISIKKLLFRFNYLIKKIGINYSGGFLSKLEMGSVPVNYYPENLLKTVRKPEYGIEMYRLLQNARIVLNIHGEVAGNYAGNMRLFEATAAGSCLLTDDKCNLNDLFDVNTEIVVYHDADECANKIRWLLKNEEERKVIALAGQKRTLQYHTVESRCREIIGILNKELNNKELC
jgi:spore maturation protein CgeB